MKTSLRDTRLIEGYLQNRLPAPARAQMDRRLRTDRSLREDLRFQKLAYRLIRLYHRKRLKEELAVIHTRLFTDPGRFAFQQAIHRNFGRSI